VFTGFTLCKPIICYSEVSSLVCLFLIGSMTMFSDGLVGSYEFYMNPNLILRTLF